MKPDTIQFSARTRDALSALFDRTDLGCVNSIETMSWLVRVLRELEDRDEWFPAGKWATIQHIESQLGEAARTFAAEVSGTYDSTRPAERK